MKNLKLVISMLTLLFVFNLSINNAEASSGISIYINGEKQSYSNQAIIDKGTTLVPLRGIFEALGANVNWDQKNKTIDAVKGNAKVWLKIGSKTTKVNGKEITISVPAQVKNGNTLVPLRFISESLGENVKWDGSAKTIIIGSDGLGNLKGTITWQYNKFIGTKADVGAKVFLIPYDFKPNSVSKLELDLYVTGIKSGVPKGSNLHLGLVNGFGQYEINDIPAGKYIMIISSKNTTRDFMQPVSSYVENLLKPVLGSSYDGFKLMNLELYNHEVDTIEIQKDKTLDVSHDFGYTYL